MAAAGAGPGYVDAHVHLDRFADRDRALDAALTAGVACVSVTETPSHYREAAEWAAGRPHIRVALGVHPMYVGDLDPAELALFDELMAECRWVGEVGLDGSPDGRPTLDAQRIAFERVLGHPLLRERVLTVHTRGAEAEAVDALIDTGATAVLHWFRGSLGVAERALAAGLRFSINPAMLGDEEGRALAAFLPPERVLVETDGPYTELEGRPAEPADLPELVGVLAGLWKVDAEAARVRLLENWRELGG